MQIVDRNIYIYSLISPVIGLYISIRNHHLPVAKNLFWLFCIFYGMVHIYNPEGGSTADGVRYAQQLEEVHQQSTSWSLFKETLYKGGKSGTTDVYVPIVTFVLAQFTDNAHVLFTIFAFVFGFFYSRNIWYIIERLPESLHFRLALLVLSYVLICPIWNINGVRMWTALHIFVYGAMPYLLEKDRKNLGWCLVSILVHFSFILPCIILILYVLIPKKLNLFIVLYVLSLLVKEIDLGVVRKILLSFDFGLFDAKIIAYTGESYAKRVLEAKASNAGHVVLANNIKYVVFQILIFVNFILLKLNRENDDFPVKNLFCFALLIYTFGNIASLVPSGGRYIIIAQMFMLPVTILLFHQICRAELWLQLISWFTILLLFPIIFDFRAGMDYWGISLLIYNPILCWFGEDNIPLIQFIK